MNIVLWVLQGLLAVHTAVGAVWKFSNPPAQSIPSLGAIPQSIWLGMSGLEILCSLALVVPALYKPAAIGVPIAAAVIAAEMLLFCGVHMASGETNNSPIIYWLVVAAMCAFIAYGRIALSPLAAV